MFWNMPYVALKRIALSSSISGFKVLTWQAFGEQSCLLSSKVYDLKSNMQSLLLVTIWFMNV